MVVLFLVVIWIAVLAPGLIRRFKESSSQSSIDDFHQQLHLLERAGPKLVEPAYRLAAGEDDSGIPAPAGRPGQSEGGPATGLVLLDPEVTQTRSTQPMVRTASRRSAIATRRARKRRRDVLLGAMATAVLTGVLGAMHALHLLWAVTGVSVLAIAAYIGLAAYAQMIHADRQASRPVEQAPRATFASTQGHQPHHAARAAREGAGSLSSTAPVVVRAGSRALRWVDAPGAAPRHAASGS